AKNGWNPAEAPHRIAPSETISGNPAPVTRVDRRSRGFATSRAACCCGELTASLGGARILGILGNNSLPKESAMSSPQKSEAGKPNTWTVMLFMAASKDEQTESVAIRQIKQLQEFGAKDDLNLLIQIDRRWPGYAERYRITKDHHAELCPLKGRPQNDSGKP